MEDSRDTKLFKPLHLIDEVKEHGGERKILRHERSFAVPVSNLVITGI